MLSQTKRANKIIFIFLLLFYCSVSFAEKSQHQPIDSEKVCLAKAIYHEARGEPEVGKKGVAKIVINRKFHKDFPKTVCKVVNQINYVRGNRVCQFSWVCTNNRIDWSSNSWKEAKSLSESILTHKIELPNLGPNVLFFKASYCKRRLGKGMKFVAKLGNSNFYSKKIS